MADFGSFIPALHGLSALKGYLILTLLFSLGVHFTDVFTKDWTQRKGLGAVYIFAIGLCLGGLSAESLSSGAVLGATYGLLFLLAYRVLVRAHLALIPLALAAPVILSEARQIILNPYVGAVPDSVLAILLILAAAIVWHRSLNTV